MRIFRGTNSDRKGLVAFVVWQVSLSVAFRHEAPLFNLGHIDMSQQFDSERMCSPCPILESLLKYCPKTDQTSSFVYLLQYKSQVNIGH